MVLLKENSTCHNFCNFWPIAKKSDSLHDYDALYKVWMNRMKIGSGEEFKKFQTWRFYKVHRMTPNQTQGFGHQKYLSYMQYSTPSPKFSSVLLYDQPFSRYSAFQVFLLTPMLKSQSATNFLKLGPLSRKVIACILSWQPNVLIKFG